MAGVSGRVTPIVALDVADAASAERMVDDLGTLCTFYKIGSELFTSAGPAIVESIRRRGARVFLDLKFHDIPNTVAQAVDAAVRTGAWMIDVHASGGAAMMRAAARAAADAAATTGVQPPLVIGITVLTSMDETSLQQTGVARPLVDHVLALARMAQSAGLHGVVASPQETAAIRQACGPDFAIVTPGIRGASAGQDKNDQSRTLGPAEAVKAGATYIVVGRPIIAAPDPRVAAQAIVEDLNAI